MELCQDACIEEILTSMERYLVAFALLLSAWAAWAQSGDVHKGDIIEIGGVKAIVFRLDEDGHGTAMTVKAFRGEKSPFSSDAKVVSSLHMDSLVDGKANMQEVFDYAAAHHVDLSRFPAFAWCRRLGEGWYIPAEEQLKQFINFWLGNEQEFTWDDDEEETDLDLEAASPKAVNERIMDAGGTPFFSGVYTSTLDAERKVTIYSYNQDKKTWRFRKVKPGSLGRTTNGRACYDF